MSATIENLPILDQNQVTYADRYSDDKYEYRHVILPKDFARFVPRTHLLTETEWRNLGVQQSPGWEHYMIHNPELHVLLFRRLRENQESSVSNAIEEVESPDVIMLEDSGEESTEPRSNDDVDENYQISTSLESDENCCTDDDNDRASAIQPQPRPRPQHRAEIQFNMSVHARRGD